MHDFLALGFGDTATLAVSTIGRVALGTFFALSGYHKLFNKTRHAHLVQGLTADGIPAVWFNQWWVPGVEFLAGLGVAFGFLTSLSAAGLLVICIVATLTDARKRIADYHPIDKADEVDDYLYLPEVIYTIALALVVVSGGGVLSLDHLIVSILS